MCPHLEMRGLPWGFPGGSEGKVSVCLQCRRPGFDPPVGKIPWRRKWQSTPVKIPCRRKWQPTPVFLPGESHGQRSLVGYSPQGRKESDMTERLHFHFMDQLIMQSDCEIPTAPKGIKAPNQCLTGFFPFILERPNAFKLCRTSGLTRRKSKETEPLLIPTTER